MQRTEDSARVREKVREGLSQKPLPADPNPLDSKKKYLQSYKIKFNNDNLAQWAGMGNYLLISPDGQHKIELKYEGEPPHGDSYHKISVNNRPLPGLAWGCMFAFSSDSNYLALSWMENKFERKTIVIELKYHKFVILPEYIYEMKIEWPSIIGINNSVKTCYKFTGHEEWKIY